MFRTPAAPPPINRSIPAPRNCRPRPPQYPTAPSNRPPPADLDRPPGQANTEYQLEPRRAPAEHQAPAKSADRVDTDSHPPQIPPKNGTSKPTPGRLDLEEPHAGPLPARRSTRPHPQPVSRTPPPNRIEHPPRPRARPPEGINSNTGRQHQAPAHRALQPPSRRGSTTPSPGLDRRRGTASRASTLTDRQHRAPAKSAHPRTPTHTPALKLIPYELTTNRDRQTNPSRRNTNMNTRPAAEAHAAAGEAHAQAGAARAEAHYPRDYRRDQ